LNKLLQFFAIKGSISGRLMECIILLRMAFVFDFLAKACYLLFFIHDLKVVANAAQLELPILSVMDLSNNNKNKNKYER
jgi:hypothetical protein